MYMQQYKNWLAFGKNILTNTFASMHYKCRNGFYPRTDEKVKRFEVPDDQVEWANPYPDYSPAEYTAPHILRGPVYADSLIGAKGFSPQWNNIDGNIDRQSHEGEYAVVAGIPRNGHGRTGVTGRGALGRWGPNHAADPIVTRWKISSGQQMLHEETKLPILQFVCIQRRDNGQWAIPGGMVDPGEKVTTTLEREFLEEALDSLGMTAGHKEKAKKEMKDLFKGESARNVVTTHFKELAKIEDDGLTVEDYLREAHPYVTYVATPMFIILVCLILACIICYCYKTKLADSIRKLRVLTRNHDAADDRPPSDEPGTAIPQGD